MKRLSLFIIAMSVLFLSPIASASDAAAPKRCGPFANGKHCLYTCLESSRGTGAGEPFLLNPRLDPLTARDCERVNYCRSCGYENLRIHGVSLDGILNPAAFEGPLGRCVYIGGNGPGCCAVFEKTGLCCSRDC